MSRLSVFGAPTTVLFLLLSSGCGGGEPASEEMGNAPTAAEEVPIQPATAPSESAAASGLVDPATAGAATLAALPHMTPELADRIVAARPFTDMRPVDDILAGTLDEGQREELYAVMFKRLDLNSATEEEILLIPGVGDRMAHEFEEYRPYVGIEQFRREIGKYVDEEEVARLEQYVRIP